jgi:outer membrane protein assembly factor BamD
MAYAYWRSGERAQALATLDRFIKLHPSSPALDYALYLRG